MTSHAVLAGHERKTCAVAHAPRARPAGRGPRIATRGDPPAERPASALMAKP